jgi:hypothetical protein
MTIFGVSWDDLDLAVLERFLADADSEPLLWEAKGIEAKAGEVRRQVCGFANSHEGGYLIIGASQGSDRSWALGGVHFDDEPPTWVSNVVGNGGVSPYPYGLDTKPLSTADGKQVAVVWIPPSPTPPCNTHGTVYERVSGRTISAREPLRLAQLFARGDEAHRTAQATADATSTRMLLLGHNVDRYGPTHVQFGLGLTAVGYGRGLASRLFGRAFEDNLLTSIERLDHGPSIGGPPPLQRTVTQNSRQFVSEGTDALLGRSWIVRATWHGDIGVYWTQAGDTARTESIVVDGPIEQAWAVAEDLLDALAAQGAHYLQLDVAGGSFPPNDGAALVTPAGLERLRTVVGRGPLAPDVDRTVLDSIVRELQRATGQMAYETPSSPQP